MLCSFPEELDPSGQQPFLLSDPNMDQPLDGFEGEPDPFFAGHELYRALRGSQGDDPLNDELLWDGDFMTTQREFIQKKQEDEMLQRLERRMGELCSRHGTTLLTRQAKRTARAHLYSPMQSCRTVLARLYAVLIYQSKSLFYMGCS